MRNRLTRVALLFFICATATLSLQAQFDVTSYGAVADCSTDNATAFQNAINAAAANPNGGTVFVPAASSSTGCYLIKTPLKVQGHRITITGQGLLNPNLRFDFGTYAGTLPKFGFIVGETSTSSISAAANYDSTRIENLRMELKSAGNTGGGVLVQRNPLFYLRSVSIATGDSSVPGYGVRVIASDSQVVIDQVFVGSGNCAIDSEHTSVAPTVGISIEDGSNQTFIHSSTVIANTTAIQVANSIGVWIERNEIGMCASTNATLYGVNIVTGQTVPSWLTWIPANSMADIHIAENIFEPGELSAETIYDVYVGSGTSSSSSHGATSCLPARSSKVVGTVIRDNIHEGTTQSTRTLYTIDNADQTYLNNAHYYGGISSAVTITANAEKTTVDLPDLSLFNTASCSPSLISDSGTKTSLVGRYKNPTYGAGIYTSNAGTWTVDSGDVLNYSYTVQNKRMHVIVWLNTTSVSGSPTALFIQLGGGYTIAQSALVPARVVDNYSLPAAFAAAFAGSTQIQVSKSDGSAFATTTNNTFLQFEMDFEVQ